MSKQPPEFLRSRKRGFTLIELIVVIVIILVLVGILVPTLARVRTNATMTAARNQIQGIQGALQVYFGDHGMYPPSHVYSAANPKPIVPGRGSLMLAQGLMGFLPKPQDGAGPDVAGGTPADGEPLYGFRTRKNMGGQVWGPYLAPARQSYISQEDNINPKMGGIPNEEEYFIDSWGHDVIYYASRGVPPPPPSGQFRTIFGLNENVHNSFFFGSDNELTHRDNGPVDAPKGSGANPANATAGFVKTIYPNSANLPFNERFNYTAGPVMGSDSFLLISAGPDELYFTDDDLVVAKP